MIKLTICTPSIPSRIDSHLKPLMDNINSQINSIPKPMQVEHLIFIDNKRRSIGMKRQTLLNSANGEYIAFIDDDDSVSDDYVFQLWYACKQDVDVITFNQHVWLNGVGPYPLTFKLGHPTNEGVSMEGCTRPPWHVCAWKHTIAKKCKYTNKMYGEDWDWAMYANMLAQTSYHIDKTLCSYHFSDSITEAK